jgi:hypothetical protein
MLYGPSKLATTVGRGHQQIEIVQETEYPFEEEVRFTIHTQQLVAFPFSFRIPVWCAAPRILVNDKAEVLPPRNGFAVLNRTFHPGDTIALHLPMQVAVSRWPQNGVAVEHGPLVYSLTIREKWTPVIEPKYTTAEFPSWNATPTSPWNYGLALDPGKPASQIASQIKVERRPPAPHVAALDPWTDPPVALTVPARRIDDWTLQFSPDDPSQQFTPPLPECGSSSISRKVEQLTLVPLGSTHLRVTIFPDLSSIPEG